MSWHHYIPIIGQIFAIVERRQELRAKEIDLERARLEFEKQCHETDVAEANRDRARVEGARLGE